MAYRSKIDGNFILPIYTYHTVPLFIEEGSHRAAAKVQRRSGQIERLTDMPYIHVDVTISPLSIFPLRSSDHSCPDEDASRFFEDPLTQSGLRKLRTKMAFPQKNESGLPPIVVIEP